MRDTISIAVLGPRERSIVEAFVAGREWSEDYYESWIRQNPSFHDRAKRLADTAPTDGKPFAIDARFIRNALISKIINEEGIKLEVSETGAVLTGARISGVLNLMGVEFCRPIHFRSCSFENDVLLEYAELGHVSFEGSSIPKIMADMVDIGGDLNLQNLHGCELVRLRRARIRHIAASGRDFRMHARRTGAQR